MKKIYNLTTQVRRDILRMVHKVNSGHPGGSLGCAEFLVVLFTNIMNRKVDFEMNGIECLFRARHTDNVGHNYLQGQHTAYHLFGRPILFGCECEPPCRQKKSVDSQAQVSACPDPKSVAREP